MPSAQREAFTRATTRYRRELLASSPGAADRFDFGGTFAPAAPKLRRRSCAAGARPGG